MSAAMIGTERNSARGAAALATGMCIRATFYRRRHGFLRVSILLSVTGFERVPAAAEQVEPNFMVRTSRFVTSSVCLGMLSLALLDGSADL